MESKAGRLFVISAPSGAGKTTITQNVIKRMSPEHPISRVVTYTSRAPRFGEKHGHDYYFVSEDEFKEKVEQNFFIEWSGVYGALYGSPAKELEKLTQGMSLIMILDLAGALAVMDKYNPVSIWLSPPGIDVLRERLIRRGSEVDHQRDLRLQLAYGELRHQALSLFQHKLVNIDLQQSIESLEDIIRATIKSS